MFNLPPLAKALIVLAIVTAAYAAVKSFETRAYNRGYAVRDLEAKATEASVKEQAIERFNTAAGEAKAREDKLRLDLAASDAKRYEDNTRHEKTISSLVARANAGVIGMRVDTPRRPLYGCAAPQTGPLAPRPGDETGTDLMPGTVATILRIAGNSARDVRQYNDLLARYNRARETCNAP